MVSHIQKDPFKPQSNVTSGATVVRYAIDLTFQQSKGQRRTERSNRREWERMGKKKFCNCFVIKALIVNFEKSV